MTIAATFCPPAVQHVPAHVGTYGPEVSDLANSAGMTLDPEQRMVIDAMYAHDSRGRLVAPEFGCAAPRQNIKTHVAKAAALADLVLFDEPTCLWTAHLRSTSDKSYAEMVETFESYDHLRRLVDSTPNSDGEQAIKLRRPGTGKPHPYLEFRTRSERGGRGLSGRRVTFDEALFLRPSMLSAMIPILSAQSLSGAVQVRYLGSAGRLQSAVWRAIRDRGRAGDALRLAWFEWTAPIVPCDQEPCNHKAGTDGCALDRPELVRAANLAIDRRMDIDFVLLTERLAMTPEDYMVERFGWWQDPPTSASDGDLDVERWVLQADPAALPQRPLVFGVDQGEDRLVSIGCAWRRRDARTQVMLAQKDVDELDVGLAPSQAVRRLAELRERWGGRVILGGPAVGLETELREAGVPCEVMSGPEFATACGHLDDRLRDGSLWHGGQSELTDSIRTVRWRKVGTAGDRAFVLAETPGIGPAAAVTRALGGLLGRPATSSGPVADSSPSATAHLSDMQF